MIGLPSHPSRFVTCPPRFFASALRIVHVVCVYTPDNMVPCSAAATIAGPVGARGSGGDPGAEIARRLPSLHAEKSRHVFRAGIRGGRAGAFMLGVEATRLLLNREEFHI